jgi:hypothetical protein
MIGSVEELGGSLHLLLRAAISMRWFHAAQAKTAISIKNTSVHIPMTITTNHLPIQGVTQQTVPVRQWAEII